MNLVHDIDFVLTGNGRILHVFHDFANLIHAVVGGGVQLHDIDVVVARKSKTSLAFAAGRAVHGIKTVYGAGEYARAGGFTGTAAARKQISVRNVSRFYLVYKRARNMLLLYDVPENFGAVFSV